MLQVKHWMNSIMIITGIRPCWQMKRVFLWKEYGRICRHPLLPTGHQPLLRPDMEHQAIRIQNPQQIPHQDNLFLLNQKYFRQTSMVTMISVSFIIICLQPAIWARFRFMMSPEEKYAPW